MNWQTSLCIEAFFSEPAPYIIIQLTPESITGVDISLYPGKMEVLLLMCSTAKSTAGIAPDELNPDRRKMLCARSILS